MHVHADVLAVDEPDLAGVYPHPDADRDALRPRGRGERALDRRGCTDGVGSSLEHDKERVALGLDHVPAVRDHRIPYDTVMSSDHRGIPLLQAIEEPRRALDVGEQQGQTAVWERHSS